MRELKPKDELSALLAAFHKAGGSLDFVLIDPGAHPGPPESLHREAAILGFQVLDNRLRAYAEIHSSQGVSADRFLRLTLQPERASGRCISLAEFLGPPPIEHFAKGFVSAFRCPPHSLLVGDSFDHLFQGIVRALFQELGPHLEIYAWSTDWSNYFDSGHEWWGAHLWTVRRSDGIVAWVGAPSTD